MQQPPEQLTPESRRAAKADNTETAVPEEPVPKAKVEVPKNKDKKPVLAPESQTPPAKKAEKPAPLKTPSTPKPVEREKVETRVEDLSILPYIGFAEALIQWVEKSIDRHMGGNYFSKAFKKGMLNVSDKYPFLDPFLAEFSYSKGKIHFSGDDTKAVEFFKGIYAAIDMVFEEMTEKKRNEIRKTLKHNLRDLEKQFHEEIEILRVRTLMPTLFH